MASAQPQQPQLPNARTAHIQVLFSGYVGPHTASTVTYIRDGETHVIVDPGMVPHPDAILGPLFQIGVAADAITDVIFSHHHPDHTLNAALFPNARFHDHWAIYQHDLWDDRPAEGYTISPCVRLAETPGHTAQDITTLVGTPEGIVACTHLWWSAAGPAEDPFATDVAALHRGRARVLAIPALCLIIPGHGVPFAPDAQTSR